MIAAEAGVVSRRLLLGQLCYIRRLAAVMYWNAAALERLLFNAGALFASISHLVITLRFLYMRFVPIRVNYQDISINRFVIS